MTALQFLLDAFSAPEWTDADDIVVQESWNAIAFEMEKYAKHYAKQQMHDMLKKAFEAGGQYYTMHDHPSVKIHIPDFDEWVKSIK